MRGVADLQARCPAASVIAGARTGGAAVVCGVMHRECSSMDSILYGGDVGVVLTAVEDPSTMFGLCCGDELPIEDAAVEERRATETGKGRAHYTNCPIWQDEQARLAEGRPAIFDFADMAAKREVRELAAKAGDAALRVEPQDMNRLERAEWV
jgi:hypothetical protein